MYIGVSWCLLVVATVCGGEKWRFPEDASSTASVRIDTKVRFIDGGHSADGKRHRESKVQSDELPFREPTETEGFYNRPPGAGRYPVRVEEYAHRTPYQVDEQGVFSINSGPKYYDSDGTLDSLQYCKCVSNPDCNPHPGSARACGSGKFLCCYKRPNGVNQQNSEVFNEVDDERPMILPGQENFAGHFPSPHGSDLNGASGPGFAHNVGVLGSLDRPGVSQDHIGNYGNPGILVGPEGPSGVIGPQQKPGVLVGPEGPTGIIGPANNNQEFIRPEGSKDIRPSESAQRGVLVGPGGPTGIIGPAGVYGRRPVLVGPGGPTGIIGPGRTGRQGVLVGPGGPTGIIGPGYGRQTRPGFLVGPGGPTGMIGTGRQILVGPGGPTGRIGPQFLGK